MRKKEIGDILFLVSFWVFCSIFITVYDAAVLGFESEIEGGEYDLITNIMVALGVTVCGALVLGSIEVLLLGRLLRRMPFGISLVVKTTIYIACILVFLSAAVLRIYSAEIQRPMFSDEALAIYGDYFLSARFGTQIAYWGFACVMALFLLEVSRMFGRGILVNFLLGKYHHPREEKRIFMFMDLQSSTTHAERLGHIVYSHLLQDCYYDLSEVVTRYQAQVYQYVGDEVVLSWDTERGVSSANCLAMYFAYDEHLKNRSAYYRSKYGMVPEFKAGLHSGVVTAAEVGEVKKELAYHGDVLNTASRIQGTCNTYGKKLLLSEQMKEQLSAASLYAFHFVGDVVLRGKETSVRIYSVH